MSEQQETINTAIYYPKWISDCSTCKGIWHTFADHDSASTIILGTYEEALSTTCPNHKGLVEMFVDYIRSRGDRYEQSNNGDLGFWKLKHNYSGLIFQSISKRGICWELLLVNRQAIPNHPGHGRILNTDWVDIKIAKQWKDRCLSSHGAKCENPFKVSHARPTWLVDVQNRCIVPGRNYHSYVAISYTYGNNTQPIITSGDFEKLQKPFALDSVEFSGCISPIIRHAMYLTSIVDERYLWADSLCVTHYDPQAASEQLAAMGIIYANAVVTIIATDGDSVSGITGLKGTSDSRRLFQDTISFGDELLVIRQGYRRPNEKVQAYFGRGWTFQEFALSRRKILFQNYKLHWICTCSSWSEDTTLFTDLRNMISHEPNNLMTGLPDDHRLSSTILHYNRRSLTFEEDALPAISGYLSVYSRSFEGGFLYGIPEIFFEYGLGWRHPGYDPTSLQRRVISGRPAENQFAFSGLPSWSWLGWKGSVLLRHQTAIQTFSTRVKTDISAAEWPNQIEEAFPITEWYTSESASDPPERRRRIQSTWYKKRDNFKDVTKPMPPGWSRREVGTILTRDEKLRPFPDGCGKYLFQHETISEMQGSPAEWYYPFPVKEIKESTPPSMPDQTQYLFCQTFQATLSGYQQDFVRLSYSTQLEAKLCNKFGKVIGKLDLISEESRNLFPEGLDLTKIGLQVDVVAICKMKQYTKLEQEGSALDFPQITTDLYLVLWVEWKDGIAYRLASGEVLATEWEKLELKKISLILG